MARSRKRMRSGFRGAASLVSAAILAIAMAGLANITPALAETQADEPALQLFLAGTPVTRPVKQVLGAVKAHSCRYPYTPAAADSDAVSQLQAKALKRGANGLMAVEIRPFQNGGKNPCWRGSTAEGTAVVFADGAPEAAK